MKFRLSHWLTAMIFAAMALVSFVNFLGRYLFGYSLAFTEELTVNLFVWLTVLGTGIAFERGGHLGMVTLNNLFPERARRVVVIVSAALGAALFVVVDVMMLKLIHQDVTLFHATSDALGLPVWIYYAGVVALSPAVFVGIYRSTRAGA